MEWPAARRFGLREDDLPGGSGPEPGFFQRKTCPSAARICHAVRNHSIRFIKSIVIIKSIKIAAACSCQHKWEHDIVRSGTRPAGARSGVKMDGMAKDILTTAEAAKILGVSVRTAQLLIEGGSIPS